MRLRLLIIVSLALVAGLSSRAQIETAEDFFNSGAQFYISNNIPAALEKTESGLKVYPNDMKLKKLEELLKQQKQQQQQSQQNRQQQKENQSSQSKQNQSQNKRQNEEKQGQKKNQQEQKRQQKQEQPQQKNQAAEKRENQNNKNTPPMTPQEAKRLLDSHKQSEQFLQLKPNVPPRSNEPTEDW